MRNCCVYSHNKHKNPRKDDKLTELEKEIENLKTEIKELTEGNKQKQEELEKITRERLERINTLIKENDYMKKYIEELKNSNAKAIKLKDDEIKIFKEQNKFQSDKIIELQTEIVKTNSKQKELTKDVKDHENANQRDNFICDKCGFSTSTLPLLIKHKTNEHNPIMSCNQCDFKAFKKLDLQVHQAFKH